ncbi:MAG: hypothetical protein IPH07_14160 [Deltaproteobacteria bacterium]|nr:hypothetical protein [Deltaproteobacteria bacterium]
MANREWNPKSFFRHLTPDALDVVGDAEPGRFFELAPGDHAEVTQQTDLTGVMLVRALCGCACPRRPPPGLAWEASIIVDGTKLASMRGKPGRERLVTDLAANVSKLSGLHTAGVRLELVTA